MEGGQFVGRKIGLTSKAMQEQLGVNEPDYGFILDTMVVPSASVLPRAAFLLARIEPEIAFWLAEDLSCRRHPCQRCPLLLGGGGVGRAAPQ